MRAQDVHPPLITIGNLVPPPVVDGEIVRHEWASAARVEGLINISTGRIATPNTVVFFGADTEVLYVAVQAFIPRDAKLRTQATERDADVWQDDSVELYLKPPGQPVSQFIVSASGVMWDKRGAELGWDGTWAARTRILADRYEVEMAIPFADLGLESVPQELSFNLCRNVVTPGSQWTSLAWTGPKYANTKRFGKLVIDEKSPVISVAVLGDFGNADMHVSTRMTRLPRRGSAKVLTEVFPPGGAVIESQVLEYSRPDSPNIEWRHPQPEPGEHLLRLRMWDPEGKLCTQIEWPLEVLPALRLEVARRLNRDKTELTVEVKTKGRTERAAAAVVIARLLDQAGKVAVEGEPARFVGDAVATKLSLSDVATGPHTLSVAALNDADEEVARSDAPFYVVGPPAWLGTKEGLMEGVPAPWTPPELEGRQVRVWGRTYDFTRGPAPAQITSRGEEMLAGPSSLLIGAEPAKWELLGVESAGRGPESIRLRWAGVGRAAGLSATSEVMFEGTVRVDVRVPAGRPLEGLAFTMPVKRNRALYLHDTPGQWGTTQNTRLLPTEQRKWPIKQVLWLLDNDRGICWFHGMKRDWELARPEEAIALTPEADRATLRVNYVDAPHEGEGETTFTFGLLAAPARPRPPAYKGLRVWQGARYGHDTTPAFGAGVTYPGEGHIDLAQGTCEFWIRPNFDTAADEYHTALRMEFWNYCGVYFGYAPPPKRLRVYLVDGAPGILFRDLRWAPKQGEWAHIAFTWGDDFRVYVNGKLHSVDKIRASIPPKDAPLKITIGHDGFCLDEFRISSIPRTEFDLSRPPEADQDTLLLASFESAEFRDGVRWSVPERAQPNVRGRYSPTAGNLPGKFGQGLRAYLVPPVTTVLDRAAELGVEQVNFQVPNWAIAHAHLTSRDPKRLKQFVRKAHELGLKVVLYVSTELSDKAPEWDYYQDEWLRKPRSYPFRDGDETSYGVCTLSSWRDWFFHHLGRVMDEYDVDGFFLDGGPGAPCANEGHGCAEVAADGERVATRDPWAAREFMLRFYRLVHGRKPNGVLDLHKSTVWSPVNSVFGDSGVDGEQLMPLRPGDKPLLEALPLEVFRAQMTGRQFGLPLDFLAYVRAPFEPEQAIAYAMVHGVSWRPWATREELEVAGRYWRVLDGLAIAEERFRPYWDNADLLDCQPSEVLTSAYVQPGRALLISVNFAGEPVSARIHLRPEGLGFSRFRATDAVTGEQLDALAGVLEFIARPWQARLLLIRPAGGP